MERRTWTEKLLIAGGVLGLGLLLSWNHLPKANAQEQKPPVSDPAVPKMSDADALAMRDVQLDMIGANEQQRQLKDRYDQLQQQIVHDDAEIQGIKKRALEAAKLDPEKWDVDAAKHTFVLKPPKPPEKKPEPAKAPDKK